MPAARPLPLNNCASTVYAFLTEVGRTHGAAAVLTAHTRDDQAETVLAQLFKGSGRAAGMVSKRGKVVRPMLDMRRDELRGWLLSRGYTWREDPSNSQLELERNFLRRAVIPLVQTRFPRMTSALARFSLARREDEEVLEQAVIRRLLRVNGWPVPAYRAALLEAAPVAVRRRALRAMLERHDLRPETRFILGLEKALAGQAVSLVGQVTARRYGGNLFMLVRSPAWPSVQPLVGRLRVARPGDYLHLGYGRKRLTSFLAERGVPPELRRSWPVGEEDGELRWVWRFFPEEALDTDARFMRMALGLARRAAEQGEVPVGAVLVRSGEVLAKAHNQVEGEGSSTAHAELLALDEATRRLGKRSGAIATMYVTLEPCAMCYGAMLEAGVERIVYGTENLKAGAFTVHDMERRISVSAGQEDLQCANVLKGFFAGLRLS